MADEYGPSSERRFGAVLPPSSPEGIEPAPARGWAAQLSGASAALRALLASSGGRLLGFVALVGVAAAVLLWLGFHADSQLTYDVRGAVANGGVIEAKRGEVTVSLSDGSSILAENETKFSVDVVGRNAALTRLVRGKLHIRVQHNEDTRYRVIAGPYEVRVVGTEFDLSWDAELGFALSMTRGQVQLVEPGGKLRTLGAGQSVQLPGLEQALAQPVKSRDPEPVKAGPATPATPVPGQNKPAAAPTWDGMVAKGHFADVVQEAEALGIEGVLGGRRVGDLKALGQAARYVGKRDLAERAFLALRKRNGAADSARQAAFFLARLQEEQGNQQGALRWLNTYLSEAPRGVYAAEAYGRRLSLTQRLLGRAAARPLAREYLERFPEGAYAPSARAIVETP